MINVSITKDPIIKDKESSMDSCSSCRENAIARVGQRLADLKKLRQQKDSQLLRIKNADLLMELAQLGATIDEEGFVVTEGKIASFDILDRFFTSAAFEATIRFFTLTFLPSGDVSLSKGKEIFFGPAKVKSTWEWKRSGLKSMQIRGKVEGKTFHSTSGMFAGEWSVTWN